MEALLELLNAGEASLWTMFVVALLAATVLPVGSEPLFVALVRMHPEQVTATIAVATVGNTLGGMTSYALGRFVSGKVAPAMTQSRPAQWLRRRGAPALLLAWFPFGGDALCVLAGWMRISWWQSMLWMALGKLARYWLLAEGTALF
jgi:membrane protein YqaA with SNARE-associated domain